jgi:hypothetical protein
LRRLLQVLLEEEDGDDLRVAVAGLAEDLVDATDPLDRLLDRVEELALDLVRRGARVEDRGEHDRLGDVRELVRL